MYQPVLISSENGCTETQRFLSDIRSGNKILLKHFGCFIENVLITYENLSQSFSTYLRLNEQTGVDSWFKYKLNNIIDFQTILESEIDVDAVSDNGQLICMAVSKLIDNAGAHSGDEMLH
ncbi:hypothetical protein TNIN_203301 [Trichonephila inaurata madagascariensis]|uniref:Uncharacterized protein n=1 Tax=Trichonephila inaurata madagascariensis TaxID=2747483 RepID=A0A8X6WMG8_9ARAC|nr:hypothetical protein TNIN_203301 [Trichonephila inaurata madagascariensis]